MIIYAELIFLSNFFIDLFILSFCLTVLKQKVKFSRLIISAVIGGIASAIIPIAEKYEYIIKIFCGILMTVVLKKYINIFEYMAVFFTFLATTFLLGGLVVFLVNFSQGKLSEEEFFYGPLPIIISTASLIIISLVDIVIRECKTVRSRNENIIQVMLRSGGYRRRCSAFYDSGNRVYAENGERVIFVNKRIYNKLVNTDRHIVINTVSGRKRMALKFSTVEIYSGKGKNIIYNALVAKMPDGINNNDIILHSDMQGR